MYEVKKVQLFQNTICNQISRTFFPRPNYLGCGYYLILN